jgi:hypothetical protein
VGYTSHPNFQEEWANNFPDPQASSAFVDFFYNGMLAAREVYVVVDGGRADIPLPHRRDDLTISRWQYNFFRVLDGLEKASDFDQYLQQAGITVRD